MRQEAVLANFGGNRNSLMRSSREELNMVMMRRKRRRMGLDAHKVTRVSSIHGLKCAPVGFGARVQTHK